MTLVFRALIIVVLAIGCDRSRPVSAPAVVVSRPPDLPKASPSDPSRPLGPLSTAEAPPLVGEVRIDRDQNPAETQRDLDVFDAALATYFVPRTTDHRASLTNHRRMAGFLVKASRAVDYIKGEIGRQLVECVRAPDETTRCDHSSASVAARTEAPYSVSVRGQIATLAIYDLSDSTNPAWRTFATDLERSRRAAGLVLDMRSAWGNDPRALLPWLESLTGRVPLAPLREIHRSPEVAPYVAAYADRYRDRGRDPQEWSNLVGTPRQTGTPTTQPIVIFVGPQCQAACELAARVLATYARAVVLGGRSSVSTARLGRDEPALVTLPSSGLEVYFYATEYLLAPEIEAATGPSDDWDAVWTDELKHDLTAAATRVIDKRLADPSWPPRCASLPRQALGDLPPAAKSTLTAMRGDYEYYFRPDACSSGEHRTIALTTKFPFSMLRRFGATCPEEAQVRMFVDEGSYIVWTGPDARDSVSRLARSGLVDKISGNCELPSYPMNRE